jgi:hypothetical protein
MEQKFDVLSQAVSRDEEGKNAAMMLIFQAIPCITHLESRVGEKVVTLLLVMAANKYQEHSNSRCLIRMFSTLRYWVA